MTAPDTSEPKNLLAKAEDWILENLFGKSETDAAVQANADLAKFETEAKAVGADIVTAFKPVETEAIALGKDLVQVGIQAGLAALSAKLGTGLAPALLISAVATSIETAVTAQLPADKAALSATAISGLTSLVLAHGTAAAAPAAA